MVTRLSQLVSDLQSSQTSSHILHQLSIHPCLLHKKQEEDETKIKINKGGANSYGPTTYVPIATRKGKVPAV